MGISKRDRKQDRETGVWSGWQNLCNSRYLILFLLFSLILVSCLPASIRPVIKIGLLAPFEGLYRRSGYEALMAMRAAIADFENEYPSSDIKLLPLALDNSDDAQRTQRAAQKLLTNRNLGAVIGPLNPANVYAAATILGPTSIYWGCPLSYSVDCAKSVPGDLTEDWSIALVRTVSVMARSQGAERLIISGWQPDWPTLSERWVQEAQIPISIAKHETDQDGMVGPFMDVEPSDAVLWLGEPDRAVQVLNTLRQQQPTVPFWMGFGGGNPIFRERTNKFDFVYWAIWDHSDYNRWAETHEPATPTAYLVYLATRKAIAHITGYELEAPLPSEWQLKFFEILPDGSSIPYKE